MVTNPPLMKALIILGKPLGRPPGSRFRAYKGMKRIPQKRQNVIEIDLIYGLDIY